MNTYEVAVVYPLHTMNLEVNAQDEHGAYDEAFRTLKLIWGKKVAHYIHVTVGLKK